MPGGKISVRPVALIWLFFLIRGLFYVRAIPIWEGFDEWAHYAYLQSMALGVAPHGPVSREVQASLSHIWLGNWNFLTVRNWRYHTVAAIVALAAVSLAVHLVRRSNSSLLSLSAIYLTFLAALAYHALQAFQNGVLPAPSAIICSAP